ncbi:glycosyltransferase family 2 protein [Roseitranquillus sediminis]|uniref:glycosyltransferase family 2 protein n=1 Tax=Roseitranquillus sediminis TaxID=2809051 RepID=UPI001D0C9331|nr:glycosyltransferase family 2 protein [Roseitranquillus sediminis]MBM9593918.1 glycosyltransferase family 2 protein [Roseitranquillus sediminis]
MTETRRADDGRPEAQPAELTVIVVSYNTRELTLAALRTLHATTKATALHVVVWDNASEDGSAEAVAAEFPEAELIASDDNIGFAAANNRVADRAGTEWLLLLNPDTEVHEGAIDNLMAFARAHPEAGIYGGRTVFPDGSLNIASCWRRITPWSAFCMATGLTAAFPRSELFNPEAMPSWKRDSVREVDIVVGCFLLIRRDLWRELGGFDLRYWMYGEEADLCARARARGWRPAITPDAQIMHLVGAASRTQSGKRVLLAQARTQLIRDHWPAALVPLGVGLMWLWGALRMTGGRLAGGTRRETWEAVWHARRDWLQGYTAPGE